jgi:hypothetical protein
MTSATCGTRSNVKASLTVNGGPMWTRWRRVKMDPPCPVIDVF